MCYYCSDWVVVIYDDSKDTLWEELEGFTAFLQLCCKVMKGTGKLCRYKGLCF